MRALCWVTAVVGIPAAVSQAFVYTPYLPVLWLGGILGAAAAAWLVEDHGRRKRLRAQIAYQADIWRRYGVFLPLGWEFDELPEQRLAEPAAWGFPEIEWPT